MRITQLSWVFYFYLMAIGILRHLSLGNKLKEVVIQSQNFDTFYFKNNDGEAFVAEQINPEVFNMYYIEDGDNTFIQLYTVDNLYLTINDEALTFEALTENKEVIPNNITFKMVIYPDYVILSSSHDENLILIHFWSKLILEVAANIANGGADGNFIVKPLETHSMTTVDNGELKIGNTLTVKVAYNIERENNLNTINVLVNKSNNYEEKAQFFIQWFKGQREISYARDSVTKLRYHIIDESSNREPYYFRYRVADNDIQPEDNVILTMMNSNDDNLVISAKKFTVKKNENGNCRMADLTFDQYIKETQFVISFSTFLYDYGCGEDLRNLVFNLYNEEDELTPHRIDFGENGILPTHTNMESNLVEIIFGRVFIGSAIKITIIYNVSENADYDIFKPIIVLHEMIYNSYFNNVIKEVYVNKRIETFISNTGKGGYSILRINSSLCLNAGVAGVEMYIKLLCTTKYRFIQHNIVTEERKMVDGGANHLHIRTVDYVSTKHVEWEQKNIKSFTKNEYLNSSASERSTKISTSLSKTNAFQREPTSTFGLITSKTRSNVETETALSVVGLENKVSFCNHVSAKTSSECYVRDHTTANVRYFSVWFHELDGCNATSCYGKDLYGNYLLYNNGKHFIIKQSIYNDAGASGLYTESVVTSKNSLYVSGETINSELTAEYHGLSSQNIKLVLWENENDCANKVGKSENHPLASCKEIKAVCSLAISGMYWITAVDIKYHVYCDMETDKGGWLKIADVVLTDGVLSGSPTHDIAGFLENPKLKFPSPALGMIRLYAAMPFTQFRLYCRSSSSDGVNLRISHLRTTDTELGYKAVASVTSNTNPPDACASFRVYSDDTSHNIKYCFKWKDAKWGAGNDISSLVLFSSSGSIWSITEKLCDTSASYKNYNNAVWKIFVR